MVSKRSPTVGSPAPAVPAAAPPTPGPGATPRPSRPASTPLPSARSPKARTPGRSRSRRRPAGRAPCCPATPPRQERGARLGQRVLLERRAGLRGLVKRRDLVQRQQRQRHPGTVEHPAQLGQLLAVAAGHQQLGQLPNAFFADSADSGSTPGYGNSSASRWMTKICSQAAIAASSILSSVERGNVAPSL